MRGDEADEPIEGPAFVAGSAVLSRAFELAAEAHAGQRVAGGDEPYLRHPLEVAELLHREGAGEAVVAAAMLHDAVEDGGLTIARVEAEFGARVAALVRALTDDPAIQDWVARKDALRAQVRAAGPDAVAIYAADKLANLRRMRRLYAEHGEDAIRLSKAPTLDARVAAWRADAALAGELGPELGFRGELEAGLDEFERERRARLSANST